MKATTVAKIIPLAEMIAPNLLQCRNGECGGCPSGTGKLLWVPRKNSSDSSTNVTFTFQYNFFDKSAESNSEIKYNIISGNTTINGATVSYSNPPNRAWAVANNATNTGTSLSPSLMRGTSFQTFTFSFGGAGGWIFFRQPNPATNNVHDALCIEYNNEKQLITFRSF